MTPRRKLIEVGVPLQAINDACKPETENPFLKNHPRSLHVWWARTPLVACRAVLFAQLVDDPSSRPDEFPSRQAQDEERARLFRLIEQLSSWSNSDNKDILEQARAEIMKSTNGKPPPILDPFSGRGSISLEGQRLGLAPQASDLNPIAVLITKALVELPATFAGRPPVNPASRLLFHDSDRASFAGLVEDIRYYGRWMADAARARLQDIYPPLRSDDPSGGRVLAWLWARTVRCPNPACERAMPMVRSFALAAKAGREISIEPVADPADDEILFRVHSGKPRRSGTKLRNRSECLFCGHGNVTDSKLRQQAIQFGIGHQLLAAAVTRGDGVEFFEASSIPKVDVRAPETSWLEQELPSNARWFSPPLYGLKTYRGLFTERQIIALTALSDLVGEARETVRVDGGDEPYADAVATYLAFAVSRLLDYSNSFATWNPSNTNVRNLFQRQAIPMAWDFAEANLIDGDLTIERAADWVAGGLKLAVTAPPGAVRQLDAAQAEFGDGMAVVSTDPPYYDNIGYAELSDFFYVWLRRTLASVYPEILSTLLVPKAAELVASSHRFGGDQEAADHHFEEGFRKVFASLRRASHPDYPITVYYAYKQSEDDGDEAGSVASTGWEKMLSGLIEAGLEVTGTWPMRTTKKARAVARGTNALASAIVLVCRPRPEQAPVTTRRDLVASLRAELPEALRALQQSSIAPVDLAQAAIGPGMAIMSRYAKVVETDGSDMSVRTALSLINDVLDQLLAEQENDFDADTRWATTWFEQHGLAEGPFGDAEQLSKAKNTSVAGLERAGLVSSRAGRVRLLRRGEFSLGWDPLRDQRLTVWEVTQHLVKRLDEGGEEAAAELLRQVGGFGDIARELAYRLYALCERNGWTDEALAYNALVTSWPEVARLALTPARSIQTSLPG